MKSPQKENKPALSRHSIYLALVSVTALLLTFGISSSNLNYLTKVSVFAGIFAAYLLSWAVIQFLELKKPEKPPETANVETPFNEEVEEKLRALEDAGLFFGASLKSSDMFRLIASRTNEIIPYAACTVFLANEKGKKLKLTYADGDGFKEFIGSETDLSVDLVGNAFLTRKPQLRERFAPEENALAANAVKNFKSAMAVPLMNREQIYGVFVLYAARSNDFNQNSLQLLEAAENRITPLLLSSQAFESNVKNALTDALTALPNERAFYMVLENQIAESQRFRDERSLTVLAIDVKDFNEHNQRFGHFTGDRLLLFVADKIKNQLRQMDFLARLNGDEFLAALPTASVETTREIIERIERTFVLNPFEAAAQEKIYLQLSFGIASFGDDGESAEQIIKNAVLRKQQSKSNGKNSKVLWFPKEFVN